MDMLDELYAEIQEERSKPPLSPEAAQAPLGGDEVLATERDLSGPYAQISLGCEAMLNLGAMQHVAQKQSSGGLDKASSDMIMVSLESMTSRLGVSTDVPGLSMENDGERSWLDTAKGLAHITHSVATRIASAVAAFGRAVVRMRDAIARNNLLINHRISEVNVALRQTARDQPAFAYIKPESWFIWLCYSDSGFDRGLRHVLKDLKDFIASQRMIINNLVKRYEGFLVDNLEDQDNAVLQDLTYDPNDFTDGLKRFSRPLGMKTPDDGMVFWQSRELPGGKAIYIESTIDPETSAAALQAMKGTRFYMDDYNPTSYNLLKSKVAALASIPVVAWMSLLNPVVGAVAAASAVGVAVSSADKYKEKIKHLDINETMQFDALTIEECKAVLHDIEAVKTELHRWERDATTLPWMSGRLDAVMDALSDVDKTTPVMRSIGDAYIGLLSEFNAHVHGYATHVMNAALKYTEKSLRQYQ